VRTLGGMSCEVARVRPGSSRLFGFLWFTDEINRMDPVGTGTFTSFTVPTPGVEPACLTIGVDGNIWFTEYGGNRSGRLTVMGDFAEFPIPTMGTVPHDIVAGPDDSLWFTLSSGNKLGRITP
jgi:virginiamycin B lyase